MPGTGTRTFVEPERYEESLRSVQVQLVVTSPGEFKARLTWAELHHLQLLRGEEDLPRIAFLSLPPRLVFVGFPMVTTASTMWRGTELQAGDVVLNNIGERLHQVTTGPSTWSLIALEPALLEEYGRVLLGRPLSPAQQGQVLRPTPRDAARLRRLHTQACRLALTKPKILTHPEVARAIEHDLVYALVSCLAAAKVRVERAAKRRPALIMVRFEEVLAEHPGQPPRLPELCAKIGVTERTLRSCCAEFLGISPTRYMLLRRLKQVRAALRDADTATANVAELARQFGFSQLGRFSGAYRAAFGESPSATLRRVAAPRFTSPADFVKSA
jgi:AraC-like DNA-binding protein